MVQEVRMFQTDDGKKFSDYDAALMHEAVVKSAKWHTQQLPDNSKLNSGDFHQLTKGGVEKAKVSFCSALRDRFAGDNKFIKAIDLFEASSRNDLVGRLLCDSDSAYNKVFHMFSCIDDRYRMFNQPYFVHHPGEAGKQIPVD